MLLDGMSAQDNVTLREGKSYEAMVDLFDHEDDALTYRWELKPESSATQVGGDFEESIANLDGLIESATSRKVQITAPRQQRTQSRQFQLARRQVGFQISLPDQGLAIGDGIGF